MAYHQLGFDGAALCHLLQRLATQPVCERQICRHRSAGRRGRKGEGLHKQQMVHWCLNALLCVAVKQSSMTAVCVMVSFDTNERMCHGGFRDYLH
jgi:hypothetical protein